MNIWIEKTKVKGRKDRLGGERAFGKAIWSPQAGSDGRDTYKNMRLVKPGDYILHFIDNKEFFAVSKVASGLREVDGLKNSQWDTDSYLFDLTNFTPLEIPVDRNELLIEQHKNLLDKISSESEVFYQINLDLRQGAYLTPCPSKLLELINSIYKKNTSKNLPNYAILSRTNTSKTKYWLYSPGPNAEKWEEFYTDGIIGIGWDEIGNLNQYGSREDIHRALTEAYGGSGSKKNDVTANDDFINSIEIDDVIIVKKGRGTLLGYGIVLSGYSYDKNREDYKSFRKIDWKLKGEWNVDHSLVTKTLTDITNYSSEDINYDTYYEKLLGIMGKTKQTRTTKKSNLPLNTILFGPPGTGKTYKTKELSVRVANPDLELDKDLSPKEKRNIILNEYEQLANRGQIVFTTFHQSFGYEDFVEGIKPNLNSEQINYDIEKGLFMRLCKKAEDNYLSQQSEHPNDLPFEVALEKLKDEWELNHDMQFSMKTEGYEFKILGFSERSIKFQKASGGTGHTLSISTLQDAYYGKRELKDVGVGIYYPGVLKKLKSYEPDQSTVKSPLQNYILIIDEINRGNVSAIFGELITLLEPDKRLGADEEITVNLPYSKNVPFGVPPNLYIIGTMNTADRSVEALDTALRRRFVFNEVMPNPSLLNEIEFNGFKLDEVLNIINKRIEALLDRDHTIGHSYFINLESEDKTGLLNVFQNKVIPLLQEYFFNDYQKIALVLGPGFVEEKQADNTLFPKFKTIDEPQLETTYELVQPIHDIETAIMLCLDRIND